jgi:hypothetical protein
VIIKICDLHIKLRTTTDLFSQVVNSNVWMTQKRNTGRFTSRVLNKTQTLSSTSAILFACGKPGVEHRGHVVQFFFLTCPVYYALFVLFSKTEVKSECMMLITVLFF